METENDRISEASRYLKEQGYIHNWDEIYWTNSGDRRPTKEDIAAIWFLSGEVPYGGLDG